MNKVAVKPASVKEFDLDQLLAEGRRGENIMELKADNADSTAVLAAFVLAFELQLMHDEVADFDEDDHVRQLAWWCRVVSAGSGLSTVLLMIFTSAKLRRLVGRSRFNFGQDENAEQLAPWFGGIGILKKELHKTVKLQRTGGTVANRDGGWKAIKCVKFDAREWYNLGGGRRHYDIGLLLLVLELVLYVGSESAYIIATRTPGFAGVSVVLLLVPCLLTLGWLMNTGAMRDLS